MRKITFPLAFLFLTVCFSFASFTQAADDASIPPSFEVPPMETLTLTRNPSRAVLKSSDGKDKIVIYALKQGRSEEHTSELQSR